MSDWRGRIVQHGTREEWLTDRRKALGASDWASVLGVAGAYRTKFEVWADKRGETELERDVPEFVEWGNRLEPIVAAEFGKRIEKPVETLDNALIVHEDYPWLSCSPDGWVGEKARAGYEGKISNAYRRNEWYEGVPLLYEVQCQASMFVTGLSTWWIACLIGGNELVFKQIDFDADFVDAAFPALERFWKSVEDGVAPTPSGGDRERRAIVSMFPQDDGTEIELPQAHRYLVERRVEAARRIKSDEIIVQGCDNITRLAMGEHALAVFPGIGKYTHRTSKRGVRTLRFTEER